MKNPMKFLLVLAAMAPLAAWSPVLRAGEEVKIELDASHDGHSNPAVSIGNDVNVAADQHPGDVVAIFGSATVAAPVEENIVTILGDSHVTGEVGQNVVSVLGSSYIDSHVGENVVTVGGNLQLGPHAIVDGDVQVVGGRLERDPAAIVKGEVQDVAGNFVGGDYSGLRAWMRHCMLLGRPLAFDAGVIWAWTIAGLFLGIYLLIALLFPEGVRRCVATMDEQPGRTTLAALLAFILKPILFLLVAVTGIGLLLWPFLGIASYIAGLFGKAAFLAWLGSRLLPRASDGAARPPVLAVLAGGVLLLLVYTVPVLGFLALKLTDWLGFGMVVYALMLAHRASRSAKRAATAAQSPAPPAAPAAAMASAATAPAAGPAQQPADGAPAAGPAMDEPAADAAAGAPPASAPAPAAPSAPPAYDERAGFWIRLAALFLDFVLVGVISAVLGLHLHNILLLTLAAYGAIMWKVRGTTVGGIVFGLRLVRLDGRPIDWPTACVRALGCFLSMVVAGLGFIWVVFDPERQSWHDKMAGTVVVRSARQQALV